MTVHQKVAVVTGASRGIGAGLLEGFLDRNYLVVANSRSIEPRASAQVLTVPGDVADPKTADRIVSGALERFGRIDTLVNNAGIFRSKPFVEYSESDFEAVMSVNVAGFFHISRRVCSIWIARNLSPARSCMSMEDNMPVTGNPPHDSDFAPGEPVFKEPVKKTKKPWHNDRILKLLGIDLPIIQAPMAGATTSAMAIGVAQAGGLGSIAGALLNPDALRAEFGVIHAETAKPINLNFFCHADLPSDPARETAWWQRLKPYYRELGLNSDSPTAALSIAPFSDAHCDLVTDLKPEVVSFHFGLPSERLVSRVRAAGSKILSSANSVKEAVWLEQRGCDAIIAQGWEAGGHRGMFLGGGVTTQAGTMALIPQVVDAVSVPVIAAGGIADGRGIAAAFALGASGVQIGTAYLFCPEATVDPIYREALMAAQDDQTVVTNVFTGRAARAIVNRAVRELGPMADDVPAFPVAASALQPLSAKSKAAGSGDFTPFWSGQAAPLGRALPARELTELLAEEALEALEALGAHQPASP